MGLARWIERQQAVAVSKGAVVTQLPDREQRLLAMLLAAKPGESPFFAEFASGALDMDWHRFSELVKRHRVAALVHAGLTRSNQINPPVDLCGQYAEATNRNAQHYMRAVQNSVRLTSALKGAGIACVVIKGIGIAARYYEQPSQREMIDIDVLVEADRYEDAQSIVEAHDFKISSPLFAMDDKVRQSYKQLNNAFAFTHQDDRVQVDLHWRLVQNPALLSGLDRNWTTLIEEDRSTGRPIPMLRLAPHFLYIMAHGMKSGWVRLKWLVDVDRVARGLSDEDACKVANLAKQYGNERIVAASLGLSRQLLGTPIPAGLAEIVERNDVMHLTKMELSLIFGPLPPSQPRLKDWRHFTNRINHSLSIHSGKKFKRKALLRELAGHLDLEFLPLSPRWLWLMPVASPLMGIWRAIRRKGSG